MVLAGEYSVEVGTNAHEVEVAAQLTLSGDVLIQPLSMDSTVGDWFTHPVVGPMLMDGMSSGMSEEQAAQAEESADMLKMVESMPMRQFMGFLPGILTVDILESLIQVSLSAPGE